MGARRVDVVIVGGGPAGLTTAAALVAADPTLRGRVVVLERARYPRDKPCAGALGGRGSAILRALGIEPDVPSVAIEGMVFRTAGGAQRARVGAIGCVVRRVEFDHALAGCVRARGVEIVEEAKVSAIGARADGAWVETSRGAFDARVVVGADGVGSVVRRAMGLPPGRLRAQVVEVDTEPLPGEAARDLLVFDVSDRGLRGYAWDFPTLVDGGALVCRGLYAFKDGGGAEGGDDELGARLDARLRAQGLDPSRYRKRRYAERGFDPRVALGRGPLMLVGEAAGVDPITGEGIAQAIEYGALAGPFVAAVLRGRQRLERWTAHLGRSRLGIDLRARQALLPLFFGAGRPVTEALLMSTPALLAAGAQHFGGLPRVLSLARRSASESRGYEGVRVP